MQDQNTPSPFLGFLMHVTLMNPMISFLPEKWGVLVQTQLCVRVVVGGSCQENFLQQGGGGVYLVAYQSKYTCPAERMYMNMYINYSLSFVHIYMCGLTTTTSYIHMKMKNDMLGLLKRKQRGNNRPWYFPYLGYMIIPHSF